MTKHTDQEIEARFAATDKIADQALNLLDENFDEPELQMQCLMTVAAKLMLAVYPVSPQSGITYTKAEENCVKLATYCGTGPAGESLYNAIHYELAKAAANA